MIFDKNGKPLAITWEEMEAELREEDPKFWRKVDYTTKTMWKYDTLRSRLDSVDEMDFFEDLSWWTKRRIDFKVWIFVKKEKFTDWIWRTFKHE